VIKRFFKSGLDIDFIIYYFIKSLSKKEVCDESRQNRKKDQKAGGQKHGPHGKKGYRATPGQAEEGSHRFV
jgi:hypothetical protein